jgi:hypothetical protein
MGVLLYDFKCDNGHIHEALIDSSKSFKKCAVCESTAHRIISSVNFSLDPISGDFPDATRKWAKHREMTIKQERKQENS